MKRLLGIAVLGIATVSHAAPSDTRLVVGIVVDQLRTDYLRKLSPMFGEGGFNRLMKDGVFMENVDFHNTASDAASGSAVIYTGSWPAFNGVPAAKIYDEKTKNTISSLLGSNKNHTPDNLRLSTIADEIASAGMGLAKIYSIAADPETAIIMTGHGGTGAIWLDNNTGKWTTAPHYSSTPVFITNKTRTYTLNKKIESYVWEPLLASNKYPIFSTGEKPTTFSYGFPAGNRDSYAKFKETPLYNEEATNLAIDILKGSNPAAPAAPTGMLNIEYTAAPITFDKDGDSRLELADTYIRLDSQLEKLFSEIDKQVGMDNTLVFLVSSGYTEEPTVNDRFSRLPGGEFSYKKAESLLDSYLSASHGNGDYIAKIRDNKVYLNHKLLDEKHLNPTEIRNEIKAFLYKMSGVAEVFTLEQVIRGDNRRAEELSLRTEPRSAADLYIRIDPGWSILDDSDFPTKTVKSKLSNAPTPGFILYPPISPSTISTGVDATIIAPTVTSNLNIRAPNGAESKPVPLTRR